MKISVGNWRRGGEFLAFEIDAVVIPAKRVAPLVARLRRSAGVLEAGPGKAPFRGPAAISVAKVVERAVERDLHRAVEFLVCLPALIRPAAARGQIHVQDGAGGIGLQLIVAKLLVV